MTLERNNSNERKTHASGGEGFLGLPEEFVQSIWHSGVEDPITGIGQLFDKNFSFQVWGAPKGNSTADHIVQSFGGAVGVGLDFLAIHKTAGSVIDLGFEKAGFGNR